MPNYYEVLYKFHLGYGDTRVGVLVNLHPVDWRNENKDKIELLQWLSLTLREVEGMDILPHKITETPVHIDLM